jgi:hypothetical protein
LDKRPIEDVGNPKYAGADAIEDAGDRELASTLLASTPRAARHSTVVAVSRFEFFFFRFCFTQHVTANLSRSRADGRDGGEYRMADGGGRWTGHPSLLVIKGVENLFEKKTRGWK